MGSMAAEEGDQVPDTMIEYADSLLSTIQPPPPKLVGEPSPPKKGGFSEIDPSILLQPQSFVSNKKALILSSSSKATKSFGQPSPDTDENGNKIGKIKGNELNRKLSLEVPKLPTIQSSGAITDSFSMDHIDLKDNVKKGIRANKKRRRKGLPHRINGVKMIRQLAVIASDTRPNKSRHTDDDETDLICKESDQGINSQMQNSQNLVECMLRRRAICKIGFRPSSSIRTDSLSGSSEIANTFTSDKRRSIFGEMPIQSEKKVQRSNSYESDRDVDNEEIEGDTSLGMNLTILSGKVIVQSLIPLKDGRASPAQLCGFISRGDVLISIDGQQLIGLYNLELLLDRLKPLSSPEADGFYKRKLKIKFAVGDGLGCLERDEEKKAQKKNLKSQPQILDGANDLFNLSSLTIVDHMSGLPLFDNNPYEKNPKAPDINPPGEKKCSEERNEVKIESTPSKKQVLYRKSSTLPLHETISIQIAFERQSDLARGLSGYYHLNQQLPSLLRPDQNLTALTRDADTSLNLGTELIELGAQALSSAKAKIDEVESRLNQKNKVDPLAKVRSECRSFSSRSRFSQQQSQYNRSNSFLTPESIDSDEDSLSSNELDETGDDEMLLRLAVWNKVWKEQMVDTLEAASVHNSELKVNKVLEDPRKGSKVIEQLMENQLQNLLFGDQVTKFITQKKTVALPPDEITEVLYDLALRVSTTIPSNVQLNPSTGESFDDSSPPFSNHNERREVAEATRFLLDDILPAWLNTFRPLKPSKRRVLWSVSKDGPSAVTSPDDLSLGSSTTGISAFSTSTPERRTRLEERIASLELDADTCQETCYLVTFYFMRNILDKIKSKRDPQVRRETQDSSEVERTAIDFIEKYGAYLKLFDSLTCASNHYAFGAIQCLLEVAKFDPSHAENIKVFTRGLVVPYEAKYLSCYLVQLQKILNDKKMKQEVIPVLVAAYPDIKPWQIRHFVPSLPKLQMKNNLTHEDNYEGVSIDDLRFYYDYLTLLMEQSHSARADCNLVQEWCNLSTLPDMSWNMEKRQENLMKVASKNPKEKYHAFHRDLLFLIDLSMGIRNYALALKLIDEVIERANRFNDDMALQKIQTHLRRAAVEAINSPQDDYHDIDVVLIGEVIRLLNKLALAIPKEYKSLINVSDELIFLLKYARQESNNGATTNKERDLIKVMTDSSAPLEVLKALSDLSKRRELPASEVIDALRKCLITGAKIGHSNEYSGALLKLRKLRDDNRQNLKSSQLALGSEHYLENLSSLPKEGIWQQVIKGTVNLDK